MRIETLKRRAQFQRVRGGGRYSHLAFVLEGKARTSSGDWNGPRFGFTVTKKVGNAVVRNRIRRRLKAALSELAADHAESSYDYVVVARLQALDHPFADLKSDLKSAFDRVHAKTPRVKSPRVAS